VAFLIGLGWHDVARADGQANAATQSVEQALGISVSPNPAGQSNPDETNDEDSVSNSAPQEIIETPQQQPNAPVTPAPAPSPQVPTQPSPAAVANPAPPSPARVVQPSEQAIIDFEFQGAPITAILDWYARLTNRSIISAPTLAATINFRSQTKLTKDEAIQALDSVLAINNIAAIPLGEKFLKVVQINTAKQEGLPVGRIVAPADTLGTQILPLKNAKASDVVPVLQPYLHPYGQLLALQDSNAILITETAGNLKQMMEIISFVDQPSALRMEMRSYVLAHAKAADVMARLQAIIQGAEQAGAHPSAPGQPPSPIRRVVPQPGQPAAAAAAAGGGEETIVEGKVIMTADDRTNKIFILTRPSNFGFFDRLIAELDAKVEPDVVMKVIELNYATAEDIASLLNSLITGAAAATPTRRTTSSTGTTTSGARAPAIPPPPVTGGNTGGALNTGFLQYAEGVRILPDPRKNSLLVMATKEDMVRIEQLIKSIDTSVAQVQIEVVIAEIALNNELDVGVDVFKRLFEYGQTSQTGGSATDGNAPADLTGELGSNVTAAALAAGTGGLTYFTTFRNLKLDAVIHALATTSKGKVLSTPVILTMDNQEADILVGESVPVPVSTVSSLVSGQGTLATGQLNANIEYKDVAIELKVTPRVNPDGYVRMDIEQKVNDLGANVTISGTTVPTILKREAKSSVAVQDRSTIMLGGLIKENKTKTETKVPFFGDIPLIGQLFKGQTNNKQRNELIIFIRPTVLRTDAIAMAEARRRTLMLHMGDQLELDRYFPPGESSTNPVAPVKQSVPVPTKQSSAVEPPKESPTDRQSAKVKALKLQEGDIIAQ
jgi:general secretion pathway protein D